MKRVPKVGDYIKLDFWPDFYEVKNVEGIHLYFKINNHPYVYNVHENWQFKDIESIKIMKTPHKHVELIKAWADGAEIQVKNIHSKEWRTLSNPEWGHDCEYRIKPEPKPDIVVIEQYSLGGTQTPFCLRDRVNGTKISFTFDGETGKIKAVQILE